MDEQLHSPARRLIELRIAHAELDGRIDALMASRGGVPAEPTFATVVDIATPAGSRPPVSPVPPEPPVPEQEAVIAVPPPIDELTLRRLKKQRLALRDEIARLERASDPDEPA